jgi:multicomponent Na+:H+ antiporter subunit B
LLLAVTGLFVGTKVFFVNYLPKGTVGELVSAGVLPLYNIFVGIEVASSIFIIFLALVIFKEEDKK